MLREALEYIVGLGESKQHEINGSIYSDKELYRVDTYFPKAIAIELNTLTGLVDYIKSSIDEMNEKFKEKGIQIEILREEETWALIYVYRVKKLEEDLKKNEVSKFLRENGYKETCVNYAISLLKKRLMDLKAFPHEIGVFLGYPIEDVIGFINNKGCNFKCCGYWKVYGDKEKAIKEFARYDKCRMIYTKLWNQGRSILKLTVAA